MLRRLIYALSIGSLLATAASAQVVRFQTTVGEFDMVLNPTNNPLLQGYVDNFLAYVNAERYHCSVINRAAEGFVVQTGGFKVRDADLPTTINGFMPVTTFDPVPGVPASTIGGLSNTLGTVALALPGDGMGGTDENAGTSSFFVNLTNNSFLDADFTVFAEVPDLTTINAIMGLDQVDLTLDPNFGAGPGNLGFTDVPLRPNGDLVIITRAFVITDTLAIAQARAGLGSASLASPPSLFTTPAVTTTPASLVETPLVVDAAELPSELSLGVAAVPEPTTWAILLLASICSLACRRLRFRSSFKIVSEKGTGTFLLRGLRKNEPVPDGFETAS
jgi:cyclophilin family peptidyl-prolyl cis-trans isomerase